jgi:hypothetical protein
MIVGKRRRRRWIPLWRSLGRKRRIYKTDLVSVAATRRGHGTIAQHQSRSTSAEETHRDKQINHTISI